MGLPFTPYKIDYEPQTKKWLVFHPNATLMGADCFLVCDTEIEAKRLKDQLNDGKIKRPTEDPSGYEIIKEYTPVRDSIYFWRVRT